MPALADWIAAYERAWASNDPDEIRALFTEDARLLHGAVSRALARTAGDRRRLDRPQGRPGRLDVRVAATPRHRRAGDRHRHDDLPRPAAGVQQPLGAPPCRRRPLPRVHRVVDGCTRRSRPVAGQPRDRCGFRRRRGARLPARQGRPGRRLRRSRSDDLSDEREGAQRRRGRGRRGRPGDAAAGCEAPGALPAPGRRAARRRHDRAATVPPLGWPGGNPQLLLLAEIDGRPGLEPVVTLSPANVYRPGAGLHAEPRRAAADAAREGDRARALPALRRVPGRCGLRGSPGTIVVTHSGSPTEATGSGTSLAPSTGPRQKPASPSFGPSGSWSTSATRPLRAGPKSSAIPSFAARAGLADRPISQLFPSPVEFRVDPHWTTVM